jgi:C1A family cysteine protease
MKKTHPARHFGWTPDRPDHRDFLFLASPSQIRKLPTKVDLTDQCPKIYDQGQLGSCTANAIAAAIEFERLKQKEADFMPSRLFIYYNERAMEGTVASDSGAAIRDGIKSVGINGDCPETEWPYVISKFKQKAPASCYADALKYKAVHYERVSHSVTQMKGCLAGGYPFVFGVTVYDNFPMQTKTGAIPLPASSSKTEGGHAMLAVGYDDTRKVFLIRNSWGTIWGKKGYGTIPYAYLADSNLSDDFWTIKLVL